MDKGGNSSLASGCANRSYLFLSSGAKLAIAIIFVAIESVRTWRANAVWRIKGEAKV
jgi:hypothetical protein